MDSRRFAGVADGAVDAAKRAVEAMARGFSAGLLQRDHMGCRWGFGFSWAAFFSWWTWQ